MIRTRNRLLISLLGNLVICALMVCAAQCRGAELSPSDKAKIDCGRAIFFDPRVSSDFQELGEKATSCASCHVPELGFSDGRALAIGRIGLARSPNGLVGPRRTPGINNSVRTKRQFWDLRAESPLDQATMPMANPSEMGDQTEGQVANRLGRIDGYQDLMEAAFGSREVTPNRMRACLVSFEQTLIAEDTPLSRWIAGDKTALGPSATIGAEVFTGRGRCIECHAGKIFTTGKAANNGLEARNGGKDNGLQKTTGRREDARHFKIPGLVGLAMRGPFMHDGSLKTIDEVIDHYDSGARFMDGTEIRVDKLLDPKIKPLNLTGPERRGLHDLLSGEGFVAFDWPKDVRPKELPK